MQIEWGKIFIMKTMSILNIDDNDDSFSVDDFIGGFEHGLDSMKEPSQSKYHNF